MKILYRHATITDAAAIAHVHCESWRSTYPDLVPQAVIESWADLKKRTVGWQTIISEQPESMWLAVLDDRVVGFATGGKTRAPNDDCDTQLFAVYLLAEAQRQGIGRQLVANVFADLRAKNYASVRVEVLKGNTPAIAFYERLGAQYVREESFEMAGHSLIELIYVWRPLPTLPATFV
jgi:ribosomal protein S18 acetylase RimI-like enzyme